MQTDIAGVTKQLGYLGSENYNGLKRPPRDKATMTEEREEKKAKHVEKAHADT